MAQIEASLLDAPGLCQDLQSAGTSGTNPDRRTPQGHRSVHLRRNRPDSAPGPVHREPAFEGPQGGGTHFGRGGRVPGPVTAWTGKCWRASKRPQDQCNVLLKLADHTHEVRNGIMLPGRKNQPQRIPLRLSRTIRRRPEAGLSHTGGRRGGVLRRTIAGTQEPL